VTGLLGAGLLIGSQGAWGCGALLQNTPYVERHTVGHTVQAALLGLKPSLASLMNMSPTAMDAAVRDSSPSL